MALAAVACPVNCGSLQQHSTAAAVATATADVAALARQHWSDSLEHWAAAAAAVFAVVAAAQPAAGADWLVAQPQQAAHEAQHQAPMPSATAVQHTLLPPAPAAAVSVQTSEPDLAAVVGIEPEAVP